MAKRGPSRSRRELLEKERALDAPPSAEEIGYESVLVSNEGAERNALEQLRELIPELEVIFLEILFHFQQLLEHVLDVHAPSPAFNLENLFRHLLDASSDGDFKRLTVFANGLVFMCQKERREVVSYYTFVYASVISKFMMRSWKSPGILSDQRFLDQLTVDHTNPTAAALAKINNKNAGKSTGPMLALLPDIKASVLSASSKGLHFYQRTKPLLEGMVKLLLDG